METPALFLGGSRSGVRGGRRLSIPHPGGNRAGDAGHRQRSAAETLLFL